MRPQLQRHTGGDGNFGDCHRTCIAMVLDMDRDDVPHFMAECPPGDGAESPASQAALQAERDWLAARGLAVLTIPYNPNLRVGDLAEQFALTGQGVAVVLGCSISGVMNHSVVLYNGAIYDPLGNVDRSTYKPAIEGYWWVSVYSHLTQPLPQPAAPASVATQEDDDGD